MCLLTALVALGIDSASGYHVLLVLALGAHWPGVRLRALLGGSEDLFQCEVTTAKRDSYGVDFVLSRHGQIFGLYIVGSLSLEPMMTLTLYQSMARWFPQMRARGQHWLLSSSRLFPLPEIAAKQQLILRGGHQPPGDRDVVEVSSTKVRDATKAMPLTSARSLDHISIVVLCKNLFILVSWVQLIYSASLSLQYFPRTWRLEKVIMLRKPAKASYCTPHNYGPISLLSHLGKSLERIVNCRMMHDLESRQVLLPYQFGFRADHHMVAACHRLTEAIYAAFRHMHQIQADTLDIQAAYDTVGGQVYCESRRGGCGGVVSSRASQKRVDSVSSSLILSAANCARLKSPVALPHRCSIQLAMVGVSSNATTARTMSEAERRMRTAHSILKSCLSAPADAGVCSRVSDTHEEEELQQ